MLMSIPQGARYMMLSTLCFALIAMFVKLAHADGIPVLEIVAARSLISAVLSYLDVRRKNIALLGNHKSLLLADDGPQTELAAFRALGIFKLPQTTRDIE